MNPNVAALPGNSVGFPAANSDRSTPVGSAASTTRDSNATTATITECVACFYRSGTAVACAITIASLKACEPAVSVRTRGSQTTFQSRIASHGTSRSRITTNTTPHQNVTTGNKSCRGTSAEVHVPAPACDDTQGGGRRRSQVTTGDSNPPAYNRGRPSPIRTTLDKNRACHRQGARCTISALDEERAGSARDIPRLPAQKREVTTIRCISAFACAD